jgi:septal ring factor EnvC (AmiA/AmiB activator)
MVVFMNKIDETERNVLLQDLKRLDAKKESLTKQLKETNQEIDKLEKKLKEMSRK